MPVPKRNLDIQIGAGRFANSEIWGVGGGAGWGKEEKKIKMKHAHTMDLPFI